MNSAIFIPTFSIAGMADYNQFYKDYLYHEEKESTLYPKLYDINNNGRAFIDIVIRPNISNCKEIINNNERPPFVCLTALIDTGAPLSVLRKKYVKELKLKSFPGAEITGLNMKPKKERNVNLSIHVCNVFPNTGFLDICPVVKEWNKNEHEKFDFLIGWDILKYCNFNYNSNKKFELKFIKQNTSTVLRG